MSDVVTKPIEEPVLASQDPYGLQSLSYPYNRDGEIVLPPFWDDAMTRFSGGKSCLYVDAAEFVMRRMMRDPILFATDRVFRALICEGEHVIVGAVEPPKSKRGKEAQRFRRSEEVREFTQKWVDGLARKMPTIAWHLCEAFAYGNKLCEVEVQVVDGKVVPVDVSPKPRTAYRYVVTKSNKVLGVRPDGQENATLLPPANLLYLSVGGMDDDPNGGPALAAAYDPWYRKGNFLRDEVKSSAQSGGASLVVEEDFPPAGVQYNPMVKVKNAQGQVVDELGSKVAAAEVSKIRTGSVGKLPPGMHAKFLTAGRDNFGPKIDRCDREMVMAFVGATRMTMEAQHGSRADSDTAEGVALSLRDWARGQLCGAIERLFEIFVKLNYPPEYWEFVPRYDIVTEEAGDLGAIGTFLAALFDRLTTEQRNVLAAKIGLPPFPDEDDELVAIQREADREEVEEAEAFAARFSETASFATRLEITNEAAQKRVARTVKVADRQFRSLVRRLVAGTITEEEFRDRFAYTLATGHDRAFRAGWAHGGMDDRLTEIAETYVADVQATEADFMLGLAEGLADGTVSEAEGLRRARMYATRMRGTANEAFRQASVGSGYTLTWDLNGAVEDHCAECPTYAAMSPWEPDEMFATPGSGDTPCLSNCKCRLVRSDGRAGFGPVTFD